jgi:hypothetical protein
MANEPEKEKDLKQNYTVKDRWDKLEIILHPIGGFFTGLAIAALGYFGSAALEERQTNEINMRLYSELMNQREQAENKLRSDMFKQIFDSFLSKSDTDTDKDKDTIDKEIELETTTNSIDAIDLSRESLKAINNDLLRLELLTRNFHESIDIKPVFQEELFKILRVRRTLRSVTCAAILNGIIDPKIYANGNNVDLTEDSCKTRSKKNNGNNRIIKFMRDNPNSNKNDKYIVKTYTNRLMRKASKELQKLRDVAHRISDKQIENLAHQTNYKKLKISFDQVCDDVRPTASTIKCDNRPDPDKGIPYTKVVMLTMRANKRQFQRIFHIKITNSYRKWSQVYVEVQATKPNEDVTCEQKNEDDIHNMCAKFWVGSFDFPLVDNTYLSEEERYGVAIDSIDETKKEINLVLVYFPASYAGLKEKSFYHKKVLNHLDNWSVITGEEQ